MNWTSERHRFHIAASEPLGRIDLRKPAVVRFGRRMMPRSWTSGFWFTSALFSRGNASRKAKFAALMRRPTDTLNLENARG
jgi:hypothetical protein